MSIDRAADVPNHYRHECACGEVVEFDYALAVVCRPTWTCRGCGAHVQADTLTPPRGERCGFCIDGVIVSHPSNGETGWCPYCEGKGFRAPDCGCGQGAMCQEDNYGR